jgi:hypothetical protein
MQQLKSIILIAAVPLACAGCNQTASQAGSNATSNTPAGSSTTQATPGTTATGSTRINDTDPSIIYSKGNDSVQDWQYFQPTPEDSGQDEHSSRVVRPGGAITGVAAVINFSGTGITWIGKKGPRYGIASYSIDGGPAQTVDNYNSTEVNQNANLAISGLSAESHVLSIALLDKKNAASSDYWQTLDAFDIDGSALPPSTATVAGFDSPELKFTGKWSGGRPSDGSDLSGGHYWSKEANASLSWTFVGSLIEVFGRPDFENGYMDVYIDQGSSPVASVNAHWGAKDDDTLNAYMLFAKKLAPGQHTIKLVVAGKHDNSARDNYVQIDELVAFQ